MQMRVKNAIIHVWLLIIMITMAIYPNSKSRMEIITYSSSKYFIEDCQQDQSFEKKVELLFYKDTLFVLGETISGEIYNARAQIVRYENTIAVTPFYEPNSSEFGSAFGCNSRYKVFFGIPFCNLERYRLKLRYDSNNPIDTVINRTKSNVLKSKSLIDYKLRMFEEGYFEIPKSDIGKQPVALDKDFYVTGDISPRSFYRIFQKNYYSLVYFSHKYAKTSEASVQGEMKVECTIENGRVSSVTILSATIKDEIFISSLKEKMTQWEFDIQDECKVNFTVLFSL